MVWNFKRSKSQSPSSDSSRGGSRSRSSFFGGSKTKRRIFRKDSSAGLTEASSMSSRCSAAPDNAPWRVENIRDAPPKLDEWWQRIGPPDIDVFDEDEHGNVNAKIIISPRTNSRRMKFRNCGLETWQQARKEWRERTVETLPKRPSPADHVHLVKGLAKASTQRTYELPRRMALSDLINVYQDVWDGEGP